MIILKGRFAGVEVRVHQFANDWITVSTPDGQPLINPRTHQQVVLRPTNVQLTTDDDWKIFRASTDTKHVGQFWHEWELLDDGTFRPVPRTPRT